jgi:ATP-dependent helicase HrpA
MPSRTRDLLPAGAARQRRAGRDRARDRGHQVVIVAGATGSGKTTQLPKICLELGRTAIAHTQPRRIAARTIAERIAHELEVPLGGAVGYKVRFTDQVSADTKIALVTDGILLNEIHRDRLLRRYDTIIVDEAHERSLNIDFLLGYLARILPERPDLKVIITSATIDPESFAKHFADAGGAARSSRSPGAPTRSRSATAARRGRRDGERRRRRRSPRRCASSTASPTATCSSFPGEAEIRDAMDAVRGMYAKDARPTEVLPLYGRLSAAEQHRVFEPSTVPGPRRRVILATNVAETSLTVPGIRYVVDAGTARISRYSAARRCSSCRSRRSRRRPPSSDPGAPGARRTASRSASTRGRLPARPEYTEPEILRTSLAAVILQMLALGFGDIEEFPFLTKPDSRGVKARSNCFWNCAPSRARAAARTPAHEDRPRDRAPADRPALRAHAARGAPLERPRSRARDRRGLSIQDVRERPSAEEAREQAERLHARFADPTSDFSPS